MKCVAVTGGSGHVGANLVRECIREGYKVRALVREDRRAFEGLDVELVEGDLFDRKSLQVLCDGADSVYHLAAYISVDGKKDRLLEETNVAGVRNIVDACKSCGVRRLVHVSSIHAFSTHPNCEIIDEARCRADGVRNCYPYDRSKAEGQRLVEEEAENGLDAVIVNPTAVLGPEDYKVSEMGGVLLDLYHNRLPALVGSGYNWVDARDVARGIISADLYGRRGECYLLSGHWAGLAELAGLITKITGKRTKRFVIPIRIALFVSCFNAAVHRIRRKHTKFTPFSIKSLLSHRYISHQKATNVLGYTHRNFEETVRDTLAWFEKAGMLEEGWIKGKNFETATVPGR